MKQKIEYVVTSKPGMTPFFTTAKKSEAKKASKQAKQQGLDGEIKEYVESK